MEIEFLHGNFTEKNPKLLMEHIQRMASGEAPFFSTTLSLVYDKLVERVFTQPVVSSPSPSPSLGKPTETGIQSVAEATPSTQSSNLPDLANWWANPARSPNPLPSSPAYNPVPYGAMCLVCSQCGNGARIQFLHEGVRCPICPSRGPKKGKPFMRCPACHLVRNDHRDTCIRFACQARFM